MQELFYKMNKIGTKCLCWVFHLYNCRINKTEETWFPDKHFCFNIMYYHILWRDMSRCFIKCDINLSISVSQLKCYSHQNVFEFYIIYITLYIFFVYIFLWYFSTLKCSTYTVLGICNLNYNWEYCPIEYFWKC